MHHLGTVQLETSRLTLRRFTTADAPAMFYNWANDAEVTKFLTWQPHGDIAETQRILAIWEAAYEKPNHYSWAIEIRESGELVGSIAAVHQNEDTRMVHVGYCIGRTWWHMGVASEALRRLVRFFFEEVGVNRVESRHDPRNPNSGKVMQKAGLRYEGTLREADRNNQIGFCDAAYYGILAREYFGND
ncbi:MAG: GNAT family N-acetyltransferase [Clostridiales bacterium]|nr:GNAT family N-acetyltransferase [Clostridiales bacterium]